MLADRNETADGGDGDGDEGGYMRDDGMSGV